MLVRSSYCPSIGQIFPARGLFWAYFPLPTNEFSCVMMPNLGMLPLHPCLLWRTASVAPQHRGARSRSFASSPRPKASGTNPDSHGACKIASAPGRLACFLAGAPALLGEFYPSFHCTNGSEGAAGQGCGAWAPAPLPAEWMCPFHPGLAGRVLSPRLAERWRHVPQVPLVASRCLAAGGGERQFQTVRW